MTNTQIPDDSIGESALLKKIKAQLDSEPSEFLTPRMLCEIGIFGSRSAATHAVRFGALPCVKISANRFLISKDDVFNYVCQRFNKATTETYGKRKTAKNKTVSQNQLQFDFMNDNKKGV